MLILIVCAIAFFMLQEYVALERAVICEGQIEILSCASPGGLFIQQSNYGRTGSVDECYNKWYINTVCTENTSLVKVKDMCEGETSCELRPTNTMFGDTCPGVPKYLVVYYTCQSNDTTSTSTSSIPMTTGTDIDITDKTSTPAQSSTTEKEQPLSYTTRDKGQPPSTTDMTRAIPAYVTEISSPTTPDVTCCCLPAYKLDTNMTEGLSPKLQYIKSKLKIFRNSTNKYKRSLFSAPDQRMSVTVTGIVLGAVQLGCVGIFLAFLDVCPLLYRKGTCLQSQRPEL